MLRRLETMGVDTEGLPVSAGMKVKADRLWEPEGAKGRAFYRGGPVSASAQSE